MKLTFYDKDNEVKKEVTRSFVPWRMLKKALKIWKAIDENNLKEEDIDAIAALVVDVFGDQFSIEELDDQVDVGDMMAVLKTIIAKAQAIDLNPTPRE